MDLAIGPFAMRVRLTRKHAERIDGVDLRGYEPGDVLDLPQWDADLLLAEEWAIPERRDRSVPAIRADMDRGRAA